MKKPVLMRFPNRHPDHFITQDVAQRWNLIRHYADHHLKLLARFQNTIPAAGVGLCSQSSQQGQMQ